MNNHEYYHMLILRGELESQLELLEAKIKDYREYMKSKQYDIDNDLIEEIKGE